MIIAARRRVSAAGGGAQYLYFDPAGDDAATWSRTNPPTNASNVDDAVRQPTAPGTDEVYTSVNQSDDYTVTQDTVFSGSSASIDIWAYGNDQMGGISCNLYINGAWQGAQNFNFGAGWLWNSKNFVGAWTQAQVRACKIRITKYAGPGPVDVRAAYGLVNL